MAAWNAIAWPVDQMRTWYEVDGLSVTQISVKLNRSAKLVWKVCKKHGFRMRPVGCPGGEKHSKWKGGRILDKGGYVLIWKPEHPHANSGGYVREHRLVAEKTLGRLLGPNEVVHHKDDDHANNDPDNLVVYETNAVHLAETIRGQIPNWSEQGRLNIAAGARGKAGRVQMRPIDWPTDGVLHDLHNTKRLSLGRIAKRIGCGVKRLADRMHYRGIPIRKGHSLATQLPRRPVLPTASILSRQELDALRSQGILVHPTRDTERRRQRLSQKAG